jgi:hypothetical protein
MNNTVRSLIVCLAFAARVGSGAELRLVVSVNNQAAFEDTVVAKAEEIAAGIFRDLGVLVEWKDATDPGAPRTGSDGRFRSDLLVNLARVDGAAMGTKATGLAALPENGRAGYLIYVFRPRVEQVVHEHLIRLGARPNLRAVVLGYVVAHEIGHQLLSSPRHSGAGIMKASWDREDIQLAYQGQLRFSPKQADGIREAVGARNAVSHDVSRAGRGAERD